MLSPTDQDHIKKVLEFWFGAKTDADYLKPRTYWYGMNEMDDNLVCTKLKRFYEDATHGKYDHWEEEFDGALALIILFDQVPRNIYRNTPEAYATDNRALKIARLIIENDWDKDQPIIIRRYIYSPFNHSEEMADQELSLKLFTEIGDPEHLYWAKNFHQIIKEYGRFPHRDRILGRDVLPLPRL